MRDLIIEKDARIQEEIGISLMSKVFLVSNRF